MLLNRDHFGFDFQFVPHPHNMCLFLLPPYLEPDQPTNETADILVKSSSIFMG